MKKEPRRHLWKYSTQIVATLSWTTPMELTSSCLVSLEQITLKFIRKWLDTAIRASLGHLLNQSIVQPDIKPGNFKDRLRNFSPTCERKNIVNKYITKHSIYRILRFFKYRKTCVKWLQSKDRKLVFKTIYCLMQVKSIAECSNGSIQQYFWPSLSYLMLLRSLFCLFLNGWFTQVLL